MIFDAGHPNESSIFFDDASDAIIVPTSEEIQVRDPEIYMKRLEEIQTAEERLQELLFSIFNPYSMPTHESSYIRLSAFTGLITGWVYGGIVKSPHITQEYARKFNAATFDGRTLARKHYTDYYLYTIFGRGVKHGVAGAILCGSAGLVSFGSITYRNRLYYPDWAIGFTTLGALSRFWSLGLRGAIGGGGIGLIGGTIGFGFAKLFEIARGESVSEMRYFNHTEYLKARESKRQRYANYRDKEREFRLSKMQ